MVHQSNPPGNLNISFDTIDSAGTRLSPTVSTIIATTPKLTQSVTKTVRLPSLKRSALGTARKLTLSRRTQSLRMKRDQSEQTASNTLGSGRATIATVPFYLPVGPGKARRASRSPSDSIPLFNASLTELEVPLEIDVPVEPSEVSSVAEMFKFNASHQQTPMKPSYPGNYY